MRRTAAFIALAAALPRQADAQSPAVYQLKEDNAAVYDLAGTVQIEPGAGSAVSVEVSPRGAAAARLRVEQGSVEGGEALRVIFPADRIRYGGAGWSGETTLSVRGDGTFGGDWSEAAGGEDRDIEPDRHHPRPRNHSQERGGGRRVHISGTSGDEMWADLRIRVPEGRRVRVGLGVGAVTIANVTGRIQLEAAAASITASGARGQLVAETGAGKIEVSRFSGDRLALETGAGDVTGTSLEAKEVTIETGSGSIRLGELRTPRASLETGSGRVEVDLGGDVERLRVQTGSGDVAISAPPSLGARLDFETGSGDLDSELPLSVTRTGREGASGVLGDGKGAIMVETGSGSLRLRRRAGA
jgi:DUF4097 and DUF4098 domain-containing protein YvlB